MRRGTYRLERTYISTISSCCVWMLFGIQSKQQTIILKKKIIGIVIMKPHGIMQLFIYILLM